MMVVDFGMGFGMVVFMGIFSLLSLVVIANVITGNNTYSKRKRKNEFYDEEAEYFLSDEKPKHGSELILGDDGELLEVVDYE
jgi:hypothetical protein